MTTAADMAGGAPEPTLVEGTAYDHAYAAIKNNNPAFSAQHPKETNQAFLSRLCDGLAELPTEPVDMWAALPEAVQLWHTAAADALANSRPFPEIDGMPQVYGKKAGRPALAAAAEGAAPGETGLQRYNREKREAKEREAAGGAPVAAAAPKTPRVEKEKEVKTPRVSVNSADSATGIARRLIATHQTLSVADIVALAAKQGHTLNPNTVSTQRYYMCLCLDTLRVLGCNVTVPTT
jgi:hypothetical protein